MFRRSIRIVHSSGRQAAQLNHMKVAKRNLQGLTIGVPKEVIEGEGRVALTPPHVIKLVKAGASVKIESGAGDFAGFPDAGYTKAGAEIASVDDIWKSKVVAKVSCQVTYHFIYCRIQCARILS
jgi:alanine dehydrogenase